MNKQNNPGKEMTLDKEEWILGQGREDPTSVCDCIYVEIIFLISQVSAFFIQV